MSGSTTPDPSSDVIRAVDLFAGAGGLSWALVEALKDVAINADQPTQEILEDKIDLVAVNHWKRAIQTHEANHPWARHYHDDISEVNPRDVFDGNNPSVRILSGGIECTHWSSARGGKPVSEQKRMPAFDFLTWVQKLRPETVLVENVKEFESWGPIAEDGTPTRTGETFDAWIDSLHSLGYNVDWQVLNAADYGDATSRKRLFILARRDNRPEWPEPTHSDTDDELPDKRTAADIIDWSDPGGSIWTRDLNDGRKKPLKNSTMKRIAEGIRRHCDDRLAPFADALEKIGRDDVRELRQAPIPARYADVAAQALDEPFLVATDDGGAALTPSLTKYYGTSTTRPLNTPIDTITSGGLKYGLTVPQLLGQHSNSVPRDVTERPAQTIATGGKLQLLSPASWVLGQHSGAPPKEVSENPVPTVTSTSRGIGLTSPSTFLLRQQSGGVPADSDEPVPTIPSAGALGKVEQHPLILPRNGPRRGLHSNPAYEPDSQPLHTVIAKNVTGYRVTPSLIRYSHGGATLDIEAPMPTIATERGGVYTTASPYLCPLYNGRESQSPRTRDISRPCMTIPASKSPAGLATPLTPFIDDYEGPASGLDEALGTVTSRDRFALVVPELYPLGLDVKYRMLQPRELAAAQGFPSDYEFIGNKTETVEQIGNAVPVNLGKEIIKSLLGSSTPSLTDFITDDGTQESPQDTSTAVGDD